MILTTEAKVAKFIVEHTDIFNQYKNTKIAMLINTTPETLSRILSKFKKIEYIKLDSKHKLSYIDKNSLKKLYS
jgi:CRP/FNR family transcriptional regulator